MLALWTFFIILILFLTGCAAFLVLQARGVELRKKLLAEALWKRRHKIPLLLETCAVGLGITEHRIEVIQLREKVSSAAFSIKEVLEIEARLSHLIVDILRRANLEASATGSAMTLTLESSFAQCRESINMRLNDYNFAIEQWHRYKKLPWLRIFGFVFQIEASEPFQPV